MIWLEMEACFIADNFLPKLVVRILVVVQQIWLKLVLEIY